jgi:hypothetical protein
LAGLPIGRNIGDCACPAAIGANVHEPGAAAVDTWDGLLSVRILCWGGPFLDACPRRGWGDPGQDSHAARGQSEPFQGLGDGERRRSCMFAGDFGEFGHAFGTVWERRARMLGRWTAHLRVGYVRNSARGTGVSGSVCTLERCACARTSPDGSATLEWGRLTEREPGSVSCVHLRLCYTL